MYFAQTKRMKEWLRLAKEKQKKWIRHRRYLHAHAETGFDLPQTYAYVEKSLQELGYQPQKCGKAGLCVTVGGIKSEKTGDRRKCVLLRADMDGLPIKEKSGEPFSCKSGKMHACGHDLHTAMLLGAAEILKGKESVLNGEIKLLFQPAEEILQGAKNAVDSGILHNPKVSAALSLHVLTGTDIPTGTVIINKGVGAPSADYFKVQIKGSGCHGSSPWEGIDPLTAAARILLGLQEINGRELDIRERAVLTVGSLQSGEAGNVISETALLHGTLRAYDEITRERIKKRIKEISANVAKAFRCRAFVRFEGGCPTLVNDEKLTDFVAETLRLALGKSQVFSASEGGGASEDFAYIAREVPSLMMAISAGEKKKGYGYPLHHEKVKFDENVLCQGVGILSGLAAAYLQDGKAKEK